MQGERQSLRQSETEKYRREGEEKWVACDTVRERKEKGREMKTHGMRSMSGGGGGGCLSPEYLVEPLVAALSSRLGGRPRDGLSRGAVAMNSRSSHSWHRDPGQTLSSEERRARPFSALGPRGRRR